MGTPTLRSRRWSTDWKCGRAVWFALTFFTDLSSFARVFAGSTVKPVGHKVRTHASTLGLSNFAGSITIADVATLTNFAESGVIITRIGWKGRVAAGQSQQHGNQQAADE